MAEPNTTTIMRGGKPTKVFKFIVEENGQLYKWYTDVMNKEGTEGHYLIERLMNVQVGEEITLEMKKQGGRNYVNVIRAGDPPQTGTLEDEHEVEDEEEGVIDYSDDPAAKDS